MYVDYILDIYIYIYSSSTYISLISSTFLLLLMLYVSFASWSLCAVSFLCFTVNDGALLVVGLVGWLTGWLTDWMAGCFDCF